MAPICLFCDAPLLSVGLKNFCFALSLADRDVELDGVTGHGGLALNTPQVVLLQQRRVLILV